MKLSINYVFDKYLNFTKLNKQNELNRMNRQIK